ncbi:MAG: rod shape-determining protein RodA [Paludibacteraceae bacterium]|nr:rod shape-determining protein RodA [Paludibacteraceae bacterium]
MSRKSNFFKSIDWWIIGLYLVLVICGWVCIYGASYNFEDTVFWDINYRYGKQLMWIGMALFIGGVILLLDGEIYSVFAYGFYAGFIVLLVLTIFLAPDIKGSHSWLVLGPVNLQPAEFAKTATCLALAKIMSSYGFDLLKWRSSSTLLAEAILLLPILLIILQNETGSALVYVALVIMFYREGMPGIFILAGLCCVIYFIVAIRFGAEPVTAATPDESFGIFLVLMIAIVVHFFLVLSYFGDTVYCRDLGIANVVMFGVGLLLYKQFNIPVNFTYLAYCSMGMSILYQVYRAVKSWKPQYLFVGAFLLLSTGFAHAADFAFNDVLLPHQRSRIAVTLGMLDDPKKSGYNVAQSKIAIGSGGFDGKGFLNGTQTKLKYVPEQDTDFIFCTVGEEHGFVGCSLVLLLYIALILRIINRAERQKLAFNRIYGYCVASIFFFHVAINVGMVIGLTPVIGIPLPFFSYGGSSLWGFTILLFIFLRLDAANDEYGLSGRR